MSSNCAMNSLESKQTPVGVSVGSKQVSYSNKIFKVIAKLSLKLHLQDELQPAKTSDINKQQG